MDIPGSESLPQMQAGLTDGDAVQIVVFPYSP